jgi:hypothetical protein
VSSRHTRGFFGVMLAVVFALSAVIVAPASAKLSKHQKAHIRHQLMRSIKKNPKLIRSKSFIKKASLVDFTLPVTIRLQQRVGQNVSNGVISNDASPFGGGGAINVANLDLGGSLGQRTIGLGGSIGAEIKFHDSFDGGGLGVVDLNLPSATGNITTTSVPLLSNHDVSTNPMLTSGLPQVDSGCGDFDTAGSANGGAADPSASVPGIPDGTTDVDTLGRLAPGTAASDDPGLFHLGTGNVSPEPNATTQDVVLRTGPLNLSVAAPDLAIPTTASNAVTGSPTYVGKSGGQADLFGNLPGKNTKVDVTVSLSTAINSILREVNGNFPAPAGGGGTGEENGNISAYFNCRQAWSGEVQNLIQTKLTGDLKISPAITADGKLRIARVKLSSPTSSRVSLAACLVPYALFAAGNPLTGDTAYPGVGNYGPSLANNDPTLFDPTAAILPYITSPAPTSIKCDQHGTPLDRAPFNVGHINADPAGNDAPGGVTDGSQVNVAGDISVTNLTAEVLIGAGQ